MAAKKAGVKSKASTQKRTTAKKAPLDMSALDPDLFGQIITPPKPLFPYKPKRGDNIPFPECPDPFGAGASALAWLDRFCIAEGRGYGKPLASSLAPFQARALKNLLGYRDPKTGTRYYKQSMFCAPRKSAKTFLAATIGLLFLFSKGELNNQILVCATSQKQARRTFELLLQIIRTNTEALSQLRIQEHLSTITHLETGTQLVCVPAEPSRLMGQSAGILIMDELAFWQDGEKGQRMWNTLVTSQGARRNPLIISVTTVPDTKISGDSIFMQQLKYAQGVAKGEIDDPRFLPMLWLADEDVDISSEQVWRDLNPGVGYSLDIEELRSEFERSSQSPAELSAFAALRLNQLPKGSIDNGWLPSHAIDACRTDFTDDDLFDCEIRVAGLDYGGAYDMCSLVILGFDGDRMLVRQVSWISNDGYQRLRSATPVDQFVESGQLIINGDSACNPDSIAQEVIEQVQYYGCDALGIDPAMNQLITPQIEAGGVEVIGCRQGSISMSAPMNLIETLVSENQLLAADDLTVWCLHNTGCTRTTTGSIPRKIGNDSSTNVMKIDVSSALLTATQILLDERAGTTNAEYRGYELIDPWTNPVDAMGWLEGCDPVGGGYPRRDEIYLGWIIRN